jgi:hypothetical protein
MSQNMKKLGITNSYNSRTYNTMCKKCRKIIFCRGNPLIRIFEGVCKDCFEKTKKK